MVPDIVSRYSWVRHHGIHVAGCLTFVRGDNEDDVLRRFGGDPGDARLMTLTEVAEESCNSRYPYGYAPLLMVDTIGAWVVIFEDNGSQGVRHEVLQAASHGTEMVSVYWNVNALQRFIYAVDGKTITEFELLFPESRQGAEPDRLLDYMRDLPFEIGNTLATAMALSERITGVRIDRSWFEIERRVVEVTPLPHEPHPDLKPEWTSLVPLFSLWLQAPDSFSESAQSDSRFQQGWCEESRLFGHCWALTSSSGMTNTSANHYHSSRLIGRVHRPTHTFFSNARRPTEGTHPPF